MTEKKKYPSVDIGRCTLCMGCLEVAPTIFQFNKDLNIIEVAEHENYSDEEVDEAIKICPADCIEWDGGS